MKKEYVLKCLTSKDSIIGYLKFIKKDIAFIVKKESDATKFVNFDEALYYKNVCYKEGFDCRLVVEEVKAKPEEVKIPGYTLHGDYYLADDIITYTNWEDACEMKKTIILPNGKKVIAHTLSKDELETIPKEERKISENGHYWYWTSTPYGDYDAWLVYSTGGFLNVNYFTYSGDYGGVRLGFKNPFLKEKHSEDEINSTVNEVMDLFDYERVHKVMEFLDWEWAGKSIPEIYDLRVESRRLLEEVANKVIEGEEYYFVATDGFKAEAWKNDDDTLGLRLSFILENSEN